VNGEAVNGKSLHRLRRVEVTHRRRSSGRRMDGNGKKAKTAVMRNGC
jgi:hypothetical protein